MQYLSIIRLFNHCNIDYNTLEISKIKKILSAEFSISSNGLIRIDQFDYTKNDIFQELDNENFPDRLKKHILIWEHKPLLDCLEKNMIDFRLVSSWIKLKYDQSFIQFVSPYFADPYDKIMRKLLGVPTDFEMANKWLNILEFMDNPEDQEKALNGVRSFITDMTRNLRNVNTTTYCDIIPQLEPWIEQPSAVFINSLPQSFNSTIEGLVTAFIDFIAMLQKTNLDLCCKISSFLLQITDLDPNLVDLIQNNHKILRGNKDRSSKTGCNFSGFGIIFLILAVFRILLMISDSNRSSYSPKLDFNEIFLQEDSKYVLMMNFKEFRSTYSEINNKRFFPSPKDKNCILFGNDFYYIILEHQASNDSIRLYISNTTNDTLNIYWSGKNIFAHETIDPSGKMVISTKREALDILINSPSESSYSNSKFVTPILVSRKLDLQKRVLYFNDNSSDIFVNDSPGEEIGDAYIMEISKKEGLNSLSFSNAAWAVGETEEIPKRNTSVRIP